MPKPSKSVVINAKKASASASQIPPKVRINPMANIVAAATGNFTAAGTWQTVASGGSGGTAVELDSVSGSTAISTSNLDSSAFVPPASAIDALCFKVAARATSPSGTFTITLRNSTTNTDVKSVTVNVSDIPAIVAANNPRGNWVTFKFSSSHTPNGTDSYLVRCVCSQTGSQVTGMTNGTGNNWCRKLRTTTTQAPASGNHIVSSNELTGAAASNQITITFENTATTSFGPTVSGGPPDGIHVSTNSIWNWGVTASTAYYFKWKGIWTVAGGGTINVATSGSRMPATSSATFFMDSAADIDSGLCVEALGVFNAYGATKTAFTKLTADKAATSTVIALVDTTGWQNGDKVAFSATGVTVTQFENKLISTVDSTTQITLTAGLTNAHSGTAPIAGYCFNMNRNIVFTGASSSLRGRLRHLAAWGTWNFDSCEFTVDKLLDNTNGNSAVYVAGTTNSTTFTGCAFNPSSAHPGNNITMLFLDGSALNNVTISGCNFYDWNRQAIVVNSATTGTWTITANGVCGCDGGGSLDIVQLNDIGGTFTNNVITNGNTTAAALVLNEVGSDWDITDSTKYSGNTINCNAGTGIRFSNQNNNKGINLYLTNTTMIRNGNSGIAIQGKFRKIVIDTLTAIGNAQSNSTQVGVIAVRNTTGGANIYGYNWTIAGDTTCPSYYGIVNNDNSNGGLTTFYLQSCTFGVATGIQVALGTADAILTFPGQEQLRIFASNCTFATSSTAPISGLTNVAQQSGGDHIDASGSFLRCEKYGQTTGDHRTFTPQGILKTDSVIYNTASPSMRMTPNTASYKLRSGVMIKKGDSGSTINVTVYVRKSSTGDTGGANYNGNQQRLIVRRNDAVGITADTVLATASAATGSWEQLSGTTASLTDDGALEFYVDCDGTAGWINVDDWA